MTNADSEHLEPAADTFMAADGGGFFFACRAERLVTRGALGPPRDDYVQDAIRRQVELVSCLVNPADERFTYDLRLISRPDPELYTRGAINLALICRVDGHSQGEAADLAEELLRLLQANIVEADWRLARASGLSHLLQPFAAEHMVSIARRCGWQPLDSLRPVAHTRTVGFRSEAPAGPGDPSETGTFHVFPFLPSFPSHAALFRQLLLHRHPLALSCRVRPTRLRPEETAFLERQIAQCEKHAQLHLAPASDDVAFLRPTLQRRAQLIEQHLIRALHSLQDDAALLTFDIASPAPIPTTLVDAIAHLVSEPAAAATAGGAGADTLGRYLAGGYDVLDRAEEDQALAALSTLDVAPAAPPAAPAEAPRLAHLFEPGEAVAAFRFPLAAVEALPGVRSRRSRYRPAPPELQQPGVTLGASGLHGASQTVSLAPEDRLRHLYIVGQTGTGKTTMLRTMILDDMRSGAGLCVIDPHGDLYGELLGLVPEERVGDVLLLDPSDPDQPAAINLLEHNGEAQRYFIVQEIAGIMRRLLSDEYGSRAQDYSGPVFFEHLRMNLLLVMSHPSRTATIRDFFDLFSEQDAWRRWVHPGITDPQLKSWIENVLSTRDYTRHAAGEISIGEYVASKFQEFVFDPVLRRIFDSPHSSFDFAQVMNEGKILLVNLSKGLLTETTSRFLGMILLAKLMAAAMGRVRLPGADRRPFYAYVDEFHTLATSTFTTLLSEGRKFGLGLTLANQFVSQLAEQGIVDSIFGNVGSLVAFRLGADDAKRLATRVSPVFSDSDLAALPNWHAVMTALRAGLALEPFTVETIPPAETPSPARAAQVREASRRAHQHRLDQAPSPPPEDEHEPDEKPLTRA